MAAASMAEFLNTATKKIPTSAAVVDKIVILIRRLGLHGSIELDGLQLVLHDISSCSQSLPCPPLIEAARHQTVRSSDDLLYRIRSAAASLAPVPTQSSTWVY